MKKYLFTILILSSLLFGIDPNSIKTFSTSAVAADSGNYAAGAPITYHKISWTGTGTLTTCTVAVDTSVDNSSWTAGGAITGQTCTSDGASTVANVAANYVRVNVTAISGGGTITVVYNGWISNPATGGTPGGASGTVQYNNAGALGGVTSSSVSGTSITIAGTFTADHFVSSCSTCYTNLTSQSDSSTTGDFWRNSTLLKFHDGTAVRTLASSINHLGFFAATTSAQLLGVLSDETGSSSGTPLAVFNQSPLIVTPTIASFANANHDHSNSAGGGQISMTAFASGNRTGASSSKAVTATAAGTSGLCAQWAASGELGAAAAACGSGGGGSAGSAMFSSTTNAGPDNTATETSVIGTVVGSLTIAANTFSDGTVLAKHAEGYFSIPAVADSLTIKEYCGSTVLATASATFAAGAITNGTWKANSITTARGTGASGALMTNGIIEFSGSGLTPTELKLAAGDGTAPQTAVSYDFTTSCAFEFKAKWGAAQASEKILATNVAAWIPGIALPVTAANGGTGQTTYTKGDVLAAQNSTTVNKLAVGTDGQVLTADAASTNGVKWASNGAHSYVMQFSSGANGISPSDGATNYYGNSVSSTTSSTVYNDVKFEIPQDCTIKRVSFMSRVAGTLGSSETATASISLTGSASVDIGSLAVSMAAANNRNQGDVTQAVVKGDFVALKIINPTYATNPTTVFWQASFYCE